MVYGVPWGAGVGRRFAASREKSGWVCDRQQGIITKGSPVTRRFAPSPSPMNYLVAVLENRIKAEEAYSALEQASLPKDDIDILGKGFKTADQYGLIDPADQAWKQIRLMMVWLVPFGFGAGFVFDLITGLETFAWTGHLGNQILGGLLGAGAAAMGAFFIGGGVGIAMGSGDALSYRNRLSEGKFLVVVRGSEAVLRQATPILRRFRPETIQGYSGDQGYSGS